MMLRAILFACALTCAAPVVAQDGDPTTPFAKDDQVMNAAIEAAQQSLPLFLCEGVDSDGYGPAGGFVKVSVPVNDPRMSDEIIWIGPFAAFDDKHFTGLLANQPVAMPGYDRGDQYDFTYDMIVDWSWSHPSGAIYGHYTTRVILTQMGDQDTLASFATPAFDAGWDCP